MHRTDNNFLVFVRGRLCLRALDLTLRHLRNLWMKNMGAS